MDPFAIAAVVFSALALTASLAGLRYAKDANRIAKEANTHAAESNRLAQKTFEAENLPNISMRIKDGYIPLDEDKHYGAFTPILRAIVRNEGKHPITISDAYIAKPGKPDAYAFGLVNDYDDMERSYPFPKFPYRLEGWQSVQLAVTVDVAAQMLWGLNAEPNDMVVIRIVDTIDRWYETPGFPAKEYMRKRRVRITKITDGVEEPV